MRLVDLALWTLLVDLTLLGSSLVAGGRLVADGLLPSKVSFAKFGVFQGAIYRDRVFIYLILYFSNILEYTCMQYLHR